jgi:hypothetical protein
MNQTQLSYNIFNTKTTKFKSNQTHIIFFNIFIPLHPIQSIKFQIYNKYFTLKLYLYKNIKILNKSSKKS